MRTKSESALNVIWGLLVRIALVAGIGYFVWRVRSVLVAIILAVMLAYVLLPVVNFLCRRRVIPVGRRACRLAATLLTFILFFTVVGFAVKVLLVPFESEATKFMQSINTYNTQLQAHLENARKWYESNVPADLREFIGKQNFQGVGPSATNFAGRVVENSLKWLRNIWEVLLIPVLAFYFVLDSRSLKREFMGLVPPWRIRETMRILNDTGAILQSYVQGQILLCVIAGIVTGLVLHFLGMQYALVLAVLAGVTRAFPIIGPIVSGIPITLLGWLQSPALGISLLVFVIILHFVESKFIMPILMGERMKLHPAIILIVLLVGAEFFGLLGMFLAVPIAAIIRELIYLYIVEPRRSNGRPRRGRARGRTPSSDFAGSERT